MSRSFLSFSSFALVVSVGFSAPRLKDPPAPTYYPTALGARWVYDQNGRERVWEVTGVEAKAGETLVAVSDVTTGFSYQLSRVSVSDKGVYQVEAATFKVQPLCELKLPVREGESWTANLEAQDGLAGHTKILTVGKTEEIEVPAGKFKAVRVDIVMTARDGRVLAKPGTYTKWVHPEIGVLKVVGEVEGEKLNRVLKSFTPGPPPPAKK